MATMHRTTALAKPVAQEPPAVTRTGGGQGAAADIVAAFEAPEKNRGKWYLVAQGVPNRNRYFDGFKSLGGEVRTARNGEVKVGDKTLAAFDVYCRVAPGPLKPHRKPSQGGVIETAIA